MASPSWTPNSGIHMNDGTAEYDLAFINNDQFGSHYRVYVNPGEEIDLDIRHQKLAPKVGARQQDRHSVVFDWVIDELDGTLPFVYRANLAYYTPSGNPEPTRAIQMMNAVPQLLAISAARTQLLNWRI